MVEKDFALMKDVWALANFIRAMDDGYLRKKLLVFMQSETIRTGEMLLKRALTEGKITEKEISRLNKEYGAERDEIAEIFKMYYDIGMEIDDGGKERKYIMVTRKNTGIWRMRDYIKKTYGMIVLTNEELEDFMRDIEFNNLYGVKK